MVVAAVADNRGRSGVGWFLFALLISPLIGLILVVLLPRVTVPVAPSILVQTQQGSPSIRCPDCAEEIRPEARVCRFCGYRLTDHDRDTAVPTAGVVQSYGGWQVIDTTVNELRNQRYVEIGLSNLALLIASASLARPLELAIGNIVVRSVKTRTLELFSGGRHVATVVASSAGQRDALASAIAARHVQGSVALAPAPVAS